MGLRNYLIEGLSGTGKTSVCHELQRRVAIPQNGVVIDATAPVERVVDEILYRIDANKQPAPRRIPVLQ